MRKLIINIGDINCNNVSIFSNKLSDAKNTLIMGFVDTPDNKERYL